MTFSRIAELVSASTSRMAGSHSPAAPSISSGVLHSVGQNHGLAFANPRQKTNLRLSSSLQDFSTYHRLDIEEDDLQLGYDQYATHSKPPLTLQRENGGSSFPKDKTLLTIPFIRRKVVRVTMVVLCLFLFFLVIFLLARHVSTFWSQKAPQFYVVLDCGSTGTRVYVYESSIDPNKNASLPVVLNSLPEGPQIRSKSQSGRAYQRMETEPGFDKLVHNISGLNGAIKPLLWWAEKQIPEHAHKSTFVFLYATGGVRRLPNPDSEWLLDNAWSILKNSSFLCQRDWVKIISGMEEAYYGWIALNYHSGRLGSTPAKSTFGALDMGGSSLQVTFETKDPIQDETSLNLSIGAVNHQLSAYSLSGYGLNDAFDKSVVHLLKRVPGISDGDLMNSRIELKHPCLQSGYKEKYMCSQCASLKNDGGSLPVGEGKMGKGGKSGITVKLIGAPHWKECHALAKVAVNLSEWTDSKPGIDCELQPCALTDGLPHPNGQFYAISGFFVVFRFFNLTSEATLNDVLQKGREFCEQLWDVAKNSVPPQPFIEQYCFRAPYIVSLLREGLHIMDNQVIIGSGSITWTLGVALLNAGGALSTSMEDNSYTILRMKINPITLCAALFMSLIILICALSCLGNSIPILFRRPHFPLFRHNSATVASVLNIPSPFRLKHWSPINSGDERVKTPMSPTIAGSRNRPFSMGGLGSSSDMELMDSSWYPSTMGVSHSYSSGSLGQMQFENNGVGSFWSPHRGQMRLQSRRSQSREDLNSSSLAEAHLGKV